MMRVYVILGMALFLAFSLGITTIKILHLKKERNEAIKAQKSLIKLQKNNENINKVIQEAKKSAGNSLEDFKKVVDILFKEGEKSKNHEK